MFSALRPILAFAISAIALGAQPSAQPPLEIDVIQQTREKNLDEVGKFMGMARTIKGSCSDLIKEMQNYPPHLSRVFVACLSMGSLEALAQHGLIISVSFEVRDARMIQAYPNNEIQELEMDLAKALTRYAREAFIYWIFSSQNSQGTVKLSARVIRDNGGQKLELELITTAESDSWKKEWRNMSDLKTAGQLLSRDASKELSDILFSLLNEKRRDIESLLLSGAPLSFGGRWISLEDGYPGIVLPLPKDLFWDGATFRIICDDPALTCKEERPWLRTVALRKGSKISFNTYNFEIPALRVRPLQHVCFRHEQEFLPGIPEMELQAAFLLEAGTLRKQIERATPNAFDVVAP